MVRLVKDAVELVLAPSCGGGIAAFRWRGIDVMRPALHDGSALSLASFPLLPFSNRIARGCFRAGGQDVAIAPNHQSGARGEVIHGFGWQSAWTVVKASSDHARLVHVYQGSAWPWPYHAEQCFGLTDRGFVQQVSLRNDGMTPMPAGLGIHPYFPRTGASIGLAVDGRWEVDECCLPTHWSAMESLPDWLGGDAIDHVFTGRSGAISLDWPTHRLTIAPSDDLGFTVVYVPTGADYFCVEPVSHMTDAVNRPEADTETGLRWLAPGQIWTTEISFAVEAVA
jgi:aldose 1-epimerase